MSFSFLPALFLLPVLVLVVLFHFLNQRPKPSEIPSLFIWNRFMGPRKRALLQLIRNLILLLQILALLALILALARPFVTLNYVSGWQGDRVFVIDSSASMAVRDDDGVRFDKALDLVREEIRAGAAGSRFAILTSGRRPEAVLAFTSDRREALEALEELEPEGTAGRYRDALELARSLGGDRITLITDGALNEDRLAAGVEVLLVSDPDVAPANAGITAFAFAGTAPRRGVLEVTNYGDDVLTAEVEILLENRRIRAYPFVLPGGASELVELEYDGVEFGRVEAILGVDDALEIDNHAYATFEPAARLSVLVVGPGSIFLESFLEVYPGVLMATADEYIDGAWDLVIYESAPTENPPAAAALYVNTAPAAFIGATRVGPSQLVSVETDHPWMSDVDLRTLASADSLSLTQIPGLQPVVTGTSGPLLLSYENRARRMGFISFDLNRSTLPLESAFPILMDNMISWLVGRENTLGFEAGEAIPAANRGILGTGGVLRGDLFYTDSPGFHRVVDGGEISYLPVNLTDREESDIAPRILERAAVEVTEESSAGTSSRGVHIFLLLAAFVLLAAEWWLWGKE